METSLEYYDIILTDIRFHIAKKRKPLHWYRAMMKSIHNKRLGRFYVNKAKPNQDGTFGFELSLPEEIQTQISNAQLAGKKIRILMPKDGIPIYPGGDTLEYIKAHGKQGLVN